MKRDKKNTAPGRPSFFASFGRAARSAPRNREELEHILLLARERGIIQHSLHGVMQRTVSAGEKQVREIMIPRPAMKMVRLADPIERWVQTIIETEHSRYPVIGSNADEVIGILLAKDLLPLLQRHPRTDETERQKLLRPAYFVPESKELHTLLSEFRRQRTHMAVVKDEYGGTAGLLTLEDALEEIIGDIEDEHDVQPKQNIRKIKTQVYEIDALTPLEEFDETFATSLQTIENADTLSGVLSQRLGRLPHIGDTLEIAPGMKLSVLNANERRAVLLRLNADRVNPDELPEQ